MILQVASAIPEMLALILLFILLVLSLTDSTYASRRTGLFTSCLVLATVSTLCSLALVTYQQMADPFPQGIYSMAIWGQVVTMLTVSLICTYSLVEIYPGTSTRRSFRIARTILWTLFGIYFLICAFNHLHHLLFAIDDQGMIHDGIMAWLPKAIYFTQYAIVLVCYIHHRKEADHGFHHAMLLFPFVGAGIALFQAVTPYMLIDGIILALLLLLLFVCCQRQRVHHDRLTSVGSREALSAIMHRMIAAKQPFTLQQVSLLHFRHTNRRFGLQAGDALLREVAHAIQKVCPNDHCYRFNGTDFVILHTHLPNEESNAQLDALRERFTDFWEADGVRTHLGVSFAQVSYPNGGDTAEELINNLEYCQLRARDLPDSAVVVFDDNVRQQLANRERINDLIVSSLSTNRFFLCYQPIYDASGTKPCAAEALLRLRDEDGSIISPGIFIPAAEENGSIIQVTWMVLGKVCEFLSTHKDEHLPPISINFSAQQFAETDMCTVIKRYLDHYRVSPSQIKIEITERVFTEINDLLLRNIHGLQEMGVGLYLDDFGTGYSNLASVLNYPIEVVKVDRSLLTNEPDSKANDLLQALVSGLKQLDVEVLIEGVETSEQSHRMQNIGVDRMQGFYYARPMEEKDFLTHMAKNSVA